MSTGKHRPPKPRPESRPSPFSRPALPRPQAAPTGLSLSGPRSVESSRALLNWHGPCRHLHLTIDFPLTLFSHACPRNISSPPLSFSYRYRYRYRYRRLSRRLSWSPSALPIAFIHSYIWAHLITASSSRPSPSSPIAIDPAGFHLTFRRPRPLPTSAARVFGFTTDSVSRQNCTAPSTSTIVGRHDTPSALQQQQLPTSPVPGVPTLSVAVDPPSSCPNSGPAACPASHCSPP
ncbi:hypothetical protein B0T18DRAFT_242978 [Schizothecium vesticola]|uniref:Uncharacterized protein n=1 Tax=Schizothecium vesticola TaxID=314040 RepID=A0AA40BQ19_9PEZI|nr:hypothetical protein B0T18DRAFT_242978 [Schizothecium vesticola]